VPGDRYMMRKQRTTKVHFALIGGPEADTSPGVTPVLDSNNVIPSPNGTEMSPRDGIEIRKRYRLTTTPTAGRKALIVETAPPDVALGFLFMIVDTANGGNKIEKGQFMRDRTQLNFQSNAVNVYWENTSEEIFEASGPTDVHFRRDLNLAIEAIFRVRTRDGTAIAGVDYTAFDDPVVLSSGQLTGFTTISSTAPGSAGKFFFVEIYELGPNLISSPSVEVINIMAP
jgi:hypothetical protein